MGKIKTAAKFGVSDAVKEHGKTKCTPCVVVRAVDTNFPRLDTNNKVRETDCDLSNITNQLSYEHCYCLLLTAPVISQFSEHLWAMKVSSDRTLFYRSFDVVQGIHPSSYVRPGLNYRAPSKIMIKL